MRNILFFKILACNIVETKRKNPMLNPSTTDQKEAFELFRGLQEDTPEYERLRVWSKFKQAFPYGFSAIVKSIDGNARSGVSVCLHRTYQFKDGVPQTHSYFTDILNSDYAKINGGITHGLVKKDTTPSISIIDGFILLHSGGSFFMKITNDRLQLL